MAFPSLHECTAVYGGAFDPPHLGHREAVFGLFRDPGVREVVVLPSGETPLKSGGTSPTHRLAMARLGFESPPPFGALPGPIRVDPIEIDRHVPGKPSYTWDTLQALAPLYPAGKLAFVLGTDQVEKLPKWHRFPEVLGLCHWIVLARKPGGREQAERALQSLVAGGVLRPQGTGRWAVTSSATSSWTTVTLCVTEARALSSTEFRETLEKTGKIPPDTLHPAVESYLKTHRLYGTTPTS